MSSYAPYVLALVLALLLSGCAAPRVAYIKPEHLPDQWRVRAERTDFRQTDRHAAVVDFCQRLAAYSPYARYTSFGRSGENRELPLLILSTDGSFDAEAARRSDRPLLLVQCCIHAGECAGKDAALMLARDILVTGTQHMLIRNVNVLIMPIFSVDGHERFGAYNRLNQVGPEEMGWRVTSANLNLNRDYVKADAVEMRAWLAVWNRWRPHLFIDTHTTDGSDHRYDILYAATTNEYAAPAVAAWTRDQYLPFVLAGMAASDVPTFPYSWPRARTDLTAGIEAAVDIRPRLSTGYGGLCNRPTVLIEAHALKPYVRRVRGTYAFLVHTLEFLNREPGELPRLVAAADERCARTRGAEREGRVVLGVDQTEGGRLIIYRAVQIEMVDSPVAGRPVVRYTDAPLDVETTLYDETEVGASVVPPAAYLVPPVWSAVIERLEVHGVELVYLAQPRWLEIESYRFEEVTFADRPYEGRLVPDYEVVPVVEKRWFPPGTAVAVMRQPRAKLIAQLLEPEAVDALVRWGFFNAMFERKEYFESYAMEPIARRMLAADEALRAAFEQRLAEDEEFAKNPRARLDFFYRRSPYWDMKYNSYPIARLTDEEALTEILASSEAGVR